MSYFTYRELFVAMLAYILVGLFTAVFRVMLRSCGFILIWGKNTAKRLWRERSHPFRLRTVSYLSQKGRKQGHIADFSVCMFLFIGYILVSYVFFDGICRFVFLALCYIAYRFLYRILQKHIQSACIWILAALLTACEAILSCTVFVVYHIYRIIKMPIAFIIRCVRALLRISREPGIKRRYLSILKNDCTGLLEALSGSS